MKYRWGQSVISQTNSRSPPQVKSVARWVKVRSDESVAVSFERFAAESNDATVRQEEFLRGLAEVRAQLNVAGIDKELVIRCGARLSLWMTFYPVNGQAGVVFTAEEIQAWNELGADIYIDSFGRD